MPPKKDTANTNINAPSNSNARNTRDNTTKNSSQGQVNTGNMEIPGLKELVALVDNIAATPPGREPTIDPNTLELLEATPLGAVYVSLKPVFLKLGIAEAAVEARSPWARTSVHYDSVAHLQSIDEKIVALSKTTEEGLTNTVNAGDLKAANQSLECKITSSQEVMIGALNTSDQKTTARLDNLRSDFQTVPDAVKSEMALLDTKFAGLHKDLLENAQSQIQKLEYKNEVLQQELTEIQSAVKTASLALIPASFALEASASGCFPNRREAKAACVDALCHVEYADIVPLAEAIREDTFHLLSHCQALFSVVSDGPAEPSVVNQIGGGFEGNWAQALGSIHDLRADLQASIKSEQESLHQLKFFGFLVDQVRDGQYSLDQWAEASQKQEFGEYMDQPFDGFDALQTVAEEIHKLRRSNSLDSYSQQSMDALNRLPKEL
ncbi:hypothetical protein FRB90_004231, partial [Tulasnella sp. 427]